MPVGGRRPPTHEPPTAAARTPNHPRRRFVAENPKTIEARRCYTTRSESSGQGGNRTPDTRIFNPLLYQLSYLTVSWDGGF